MLLCPLFNVCRTRLILSSHFTPPLKLVNILKAYEYHVVFPGLMEIGHILLSHQSNADFALSFSKYVFELGAWLVRASGLSGGCNLIAGVETRDEGGTSCVPARVWVQTKPHPCRRRKKHLVRLVA